MTESIRDRYEPIEVVGRGGQGQVLKARDRLHSRLVALKVRDPGPPENREALLAEARALFGAGPHPNLPLLREDFFHDDRYVLVMDWVAGESLQTVLERQGDPGLPASAVMGWLTQVADALDHLHARGVVHGDVKPANIVLQGDQAVLVDFGLVGLAGHGTLGYAPPEAWTDQQLTPAADVYSLAATTIALLSGSPPGDGPPVWEGVPRAAALSRALRSALLTDPSSRPARASQLIERLRGWLAADLPSGVVTFLLTAVDDAAGLWERDAVAAPAAIDLHDQIVGDLVEEHGGVLVGEQTGDLSRMAAFAMASDAAKCALFVRERFVRTDWPTSVPLRLRMSLHAGEVEPIQGTYQGPHPMRASRLRDLASVGQIVVSESAADLLRASGSTLVDLGERTLEGMARRERVFALGVPDPRAAAPDTPRRSTRTRAARADRTPARGRIAIAALAAVAVAVVAGLAAVQLRSQDRPAATPSAAPAGQVSSPAPEEQPATLFLAVMDGSGRDFIDAVGRGPQPGATVRHVEGALELSVTRPETNAGVDLRMDGIDTFAGEIDFSVVPGSQVTFDWGLRWGGGREGAGVVPGTTAYIVRIDTAREMLSLIHFDADRDSPAELLGDEVPVARMDAGRTIRIGVVLLRTTIVIFLDSHKVIEVQDDRVPPTSSIPSLDVYASPGTGGVRITQVRITSAPPSTTEFV